MHERIAHTYVEFIIAHTYVEFIKIINYINFLVLWTIGYAETFDSTWHSNVSTRKTENYYVAINCFYLYIDISFLSEVYNMANNPWIGFFTAALVYIYQFLRKLIHNCL